MPVLLDQLSNNIPAGKIYDPTFFDAKLTGRGKTTGLLSEPNNPLMVSPDVVTTLSHSRCRHRSYRTGMTTVTEIPLNPITPDCWKFMKDYVPNKDGFLEIGHHKTNSAFKLYMDMQLNTVIIEETVTPGVNNVGPSKTEKKIITNYMLFFFSETDPANPSYKQNEHILNNYSFYAGAGSNGVPDNEYTFEFSSNPMADFNGLYQKLVNGGFTVNTKAVTDYFTDYSIYEAAIVQSTVWQTAIHGLLEQLFANVEKYNLTTGFTTMAYVNDMVRYIMSYNIPLDLYRDIYASIRKHFKKDEAATLCKQNLNLLLSSTMNSLEQNKASIRSFTPPNPAKPMPASVQSLSPEQKRAVESTEPLILVQAGAGTGKALPLDTPICTPNGWKTMGELRVGDTITGSDGKPCKVLRIHEQGPKDGYDLTFRDGSAVTACKEHLWTIHMIDHGKEIEKTVTTEEWLEPKYLNHGFLPMVKPVEYAYGEKELPIDPYFLGALLANGSLTGNSIQYTKSEKSVYEAVKDAAGRNDYEMYGATTEGSTAKRWRFRHKDDGSHHSILKTVIRTLGLDVTSHGKFIPEIYKTASVEQRKALLSGLFDGNGDIRPGRTYARYNAAGDQLAEDVLQLLWSLGLAATKQRQAHEKGDYWSVNLLDSSWDPFLASTYKGKAKGEVRPMRRSLVDYQPVSQVPMRCIEVDAEDKLYVAKDFIVTHNSTLILGRIDYLISCGVKPEDIMVLSFTNAAADHIKDKNPDIHSMTIARMIHELYSANFQGHELSSLDTIINSIDIYYPNLPLLTNGKEPVEKRFKNVLYKLQKNEANAFTEANNFIEENYDDVIRILDTMRQTSLELEIIICYQQIDNLTEPASITSKFLIMDEVQDNSVFEFIYTLRYVNKHKEPLFIVGDCSQTLYEFRASNPKALNILEGSGTFATYQLNVNYRSNQEILNFANIALQNIEANQYAHIQLQANSLKAVTEASFLEKVNFNYHRVQKITEFGDALPSIFATEINPYIKQCLARNEQVAFLAFTRNEIKRLESILAAQFPGTNTVSLVPTKMYNSTVMSTYIKKYWKELKFAPTGNMVNIIQTEIMNKLAYLTWDHHKAAPQVQSMLAKWKAEQGATINMWSNQVNRGQITQDVFLDLVKENMLQYEINTNAVKQALLSAQNQKQKETDNIRNANFLLSTIHSAKGLEFDNVVVFHRNANNMDEEKKRMYYVAFTRAMKSEYILSYDTVASPQIEADYKTVLQVLHAKSPAPNSPLNVPVTTHKVKI